MQLLDQEHPNLHQTPVWETDFGLYKLQCTAEINMHLVHQQSLKEWKKMKEKQENKGKKSWQLFLEQKINFIEHNSWNSPVLHEDFVGVCFFS